jgi:prophage regulatory protein
MKSEFTGRGGSGSTLRRGLRLPAVLAAMGWSRSTLYAKIAEGKFPKPVKPDPDGRAVMWWEDEVIEKQQAANAARDVTEAA